MTQTKLMVPTHSGSDPDVIEIDDAKNVYGDCEVDDFGSLTEPCLSSRNPAGQCQYSWHDKWTRCIHCGQPSELDR